MKKRYKTKFDYIHFYNRWDRRRHFRNGDWVILGFAKWYASPWRFRYYISFFGFEISFWFDRYDL